MEKLRHAMSIGLSAPWPVSDMVKAYAENRGIKPAQVLREALWQHDELREMLVEGGFDFIDGYFWSDEGNDRA